MALLISTITLLFALAIYLRLASALGKHLARRAASPFIAGDCQNCGRSLPSDRITYCTRACRWADDDHGPNGDEL